jgi:hypothetical protein
MIDLFAFGRAQLMLQIVRKRVYVVRRRFSIVSDECAKLIVLLYSLLIIELVMIIFTVWAASVKFGRPAGFAWKCITIKIDMGKNGHDSILLS